MQSSLENLPPFYVGQKVVATEGHIDFNKGDLFIVKRIFKSTCGCGWVVDIGTSPSSNLQMCGDCGTIFKHQNSYRSKRFAPLQESVFPTLTLSRVIEKELKLTSMN